MGNNKVSEFWGGGGLTFNPITGAPQQSLAFPVIQSDISGVWGDSTTDINKSDLSGGTMLPGSDPSLNMPFGYIKNLIKIPRNLNGVGITIDPSNILLPNDSCGFAPYLKFSNLKTYITVSAIVPIHYQTTYPPWVFPMPTIPSNCNDISYNKLVGTAVALVEWGWADIVTVGLIKSMCCKRNIYIKGIETGFGLIFPEGEFGLFDINIEVFQITNYTTLSQRINYTPHFSETLYGQFPGWDWGSFGPVLQFITHDVRDSINIWPWMIESIKMTQGTIEPSYNQTKYNATKQSYLSCLEDGTKKINFKKNTINNNIVKAYCKQ